MVQMLMIIAILAVSSRLTRYKGDTSTLSLASVRFDPSGVYGLDSDGGDVVAAAQ